MGFTGDRNENLLWRIRHGELSKVTPEQVILHIGTNNLRSGDTPEKTAEGILHNVRAIHAVCPAAKVHLLLPLEKDVPHREEMAALLQKKLTDDARLEILDLSGEYAAEGTAALEKRFL